MKIYKLGAQSPVFDDFESVYLATGVVLIGNITIGRDVNMWPYAVVRGDNEPIVIGQSTNIQEHSLLHTDPGYPLRIGEKCTIGHCAILHGCTIGDGSLIGMGAIVLNGAKIGKNCLVGAGSLVTEGKEFPDGSLIVGSPAKLVRVLNADQIKSLEKSALHYVANSKRFKTELSEL